MKAVNSALYKVLIEAKVSDELATEAAEIDLKAMKNVEEVKARLSLVGRLLWLVIALVSTGLLKDFFFS